jgi:hypothetical protein
MWYSILMYAIAVGAIIRNLWLTYQLDKARSETQEWKDRAYRAGLLIGIAVELGKDEEVGEGWYTMARSVMKESGIVTSYQEDQS